MSNAQRVDACRPTGTYLTDPAKFEHIWRVAKYRHVVLTPDTLRGKPEDCLSHAASMRLMRSIHAHAKHLCRPWPTRDGS